MYCTKCGNKIDDNANFCPRCGEKITRENNNTPQQDMPSKDKNISQEKIDLNKKGTIKENNEEKIDLSKCKININNDKVEENKGQDEFKSEASSCIYGNKEFKISAQKHTEGTEYETIITFNETDITIKKETKKKFKKYSKEYKFNIDDVLYVTNTKHLSTFMMIFTVCATLACIYAFGIKALFILIIDIIFSIYRCIEIGFKNGDKINIVLDGIFGKRDCTEIIEHMNRISGERISNDKKHSQNVIIKNILSILAATGLVLGFGMYTALTEPGSNIKIDNPYKDENIENLYKEINETSSDINENTSINKKEATQMYEEQDIGVLEGTWQDDEGYEIRINSKFINGLNYSIEEEYSDGIEIFLYDEDLVHDVLIQYIDYNCILVYEYDNEIEDFAELGYFYRQ